MQFSQVATMHAATKLVLWHRRSMYSTNQATNTQFAGIIVIHSKFSTSSRNADGWVQQLKAGVKSVSLMENTKVLLKI